MSDVFYTNVARRGNRILVRGVNDGTPFRKEVEFHPTLFIPSNKESKWKTLEGANVEPINPGNMNDCREFIQKYSGVSGFEIYGNTDYIYQFIGKIHPGEVDYKFNDIRVGYIDIETTCENGFPKIDDPEEEVIAITLIIGDKKWVFARGEFDQPEDAVCYSHHDEEYVLQEFLNVWMQEYPDIISGWNIRFFDIPYLYNRIKRVFGDKVAKTLSPWNVIKERTVVRMNREQTAYELLGIATLDYYELYLTFTYTSQESYRLDHIASIELGEKKISYEEFDNIAEFYRQDFNKFVQYNYQDTVLVKRLEEKLKLMELAVALAYSAKVNFMDVYSQVRTWDQIIYHYLNERNIVIPQKKGQSKNEQYAGAYVKEPIVGRHEWVVSFDLNSLYPHLIMQYNISPETLVPMSEDSRFGIGPNNILNGPDNFYAKGTFEKIEDFKSQGYSVAANGSCYSKDHQGFLPALMEKMYVERKMYKKKMIECEKQKQKDPNNKELDYDIAIFHNFQQVRKIQLNSAYGAIGNEWFRYYDVLMAEAITLSGQLSIRWIINHLNSFLNQTLKTKDVDYVVASDTDSVYLRLGGLVDHFLGDGKSDREVVEFLDKSCREIIQPFIDKKYEELCTLMSAYDNKMVMEREVIADVGIWTAKKRYMLNVHDSEGVRYDPPKRKIMGIETTRSSTPQVVRDWLKESIRIIMNENEETLVDYIADRKDEFMNLDVEDIAFPRSVSNLTKYIDSSSIYKKSTPIAVKGALLYNHYIKKNKLDRKYQLINEGEKVKFVMLKEQNPICGSKGDQVISFVSRYPMDLIDKKYVDYTTQFQKSFIDPLTSILNVIGWKTEKVSSLESLFI